MQHKDELAARPAMDDSVAPARFFQTMKIASSFLISVFVAVTVLPIPTGWSDVGPARARQVQSEPEKASEPAPVKTLPKSPVPRHPVQQQRTQEEPIPSADWMGEVRKRLIYDDLEIHPRFRAEHVLDSNVLLEARDEKLDNIFREVPGIEVVLPIGDHYVKADYETQFEQYVKTNNNNTENQEFKTEVALNFTDMYIVTKESISHTTSRAGTTFTERIPRFENDVSTHVGYKFNRFTLDSGYGNFYRSFDTSREKNLNYRTNKWMGNLAMDLTAKTKMFVDYVFTDYDYSKDPTRDGVGNQIAGGLQGSFLPKTSLYSKFGYERVSFGTAGEIDSNNFVAEVGALYEPVAKTTIDVGWKRQTAQSTFANTNFFTEDRLFVRLRHDFTEKISGETGIAYANQDYDERNNFGAGAFLGKRDDDLLTIDVKLLYQFTDWLSGDIKYQYNRRDSNASLFDYTDNLLVTGLALQV